MINVQHIATIAQYNAIAGHKTLHPLVSVVNFSQLVKAAGNGGQKPLVQAISFGFYAIFFKENKHCDIRYGRNRYDYQEGTLIFIAPHQVVSIEEDGEDYQPSGMALLFNADVLHGTPLAAQMPGYTFFSYDVFEALHVSADERDIVFECLNKITYELNHLVDKYSKKLMVANIELLLNYCVRFYDRQFITRGHAGMGASATFENLLNEFFTTNKPLTLGIPSVAYFAKQMHLSPNYFGDVIRKETGKTPQELIQLKLLSLSKEKILSGSLTVSQVASQLGFKYPQHFTRFFKKHIGQSPQQYRLVYN